jgi:hypothetical protein
MDTKSLQFEEELQYLTRIKVNDAKVEILGTYPGDTVYARITFVDCIIEGEVSEKNDEYILHNGIHIQNVCDISRNRAVVRLNSAKYDGDGHLIRYDGDLPNVEHAEEGESPETFICVITDYIRFCKMAVKYKRGRIVAVAFIQPRTLHKEEFTFIGEVGENSENSENSSYLIKANNDTLTNNFAEIRGSQKYQIDLSLFTKPHGIENWPSVPLISVDTSLKFQRIDEYWERLRTCLIDHL